MACRVLLNSKYISILPYLILVKTQTAGDLIVQYVHGFHDTDVVQTKKCIYIYLYLYYYRYRGRVTFR